MPVTPETYEEVMNKHGWCCAECGSHEFVELHHRKANTKVNRNLYPHFIDSKYNLIPLCGPFNKNCHEKCKHKYKISDKKAEEFEEMLKND